MEIEELHVRVRAYAAERTPSITGARVVLAVSGGGDSCAMAALVIDADIVAPEQATVAHFDHRLRGEGAARADRDAVEALCERYGVALEFGAWDDPRPGEAAAREARYRFLAGVARARDATAIVTGHTQDDQVETVILHTMRGAGPYGLAGMAPESRGPFGAHRGPALLRPLLCVSREETRAYCAARGIAYVDDASNEDVRFERNRIRQELLPELDAASAEGRAIIVAMADRTREAIAMMERATSVALLGADARGVRLSRAELRRMTGELSPYAYRQALRLLLGEEREFERRHYAIMAAAPDAQTGSTLKLPRGVVLTVDPDEILLTVGEPDVAVVPPDFERTAPFSGVAGAWRIDMRPAGEANEGAILLPAGAVVRGRRPGDRIRPAGMRGHKKLQDYYVDRKVPRRERDAAPVIAAGGDVLWTPFGAAATASGGARYVVAAERATTCDP